MGKNLYQHQLNDYQSLIRILTEISIRIPDYAWQSSLYHDSTLHILLNLVDGIVNAIEKLEVFILLGDRKDWQMKHRAGSVKPGIKGISSREE